MAALSPGPLSSVLPPRARGTPPGKGKFGVGLVGERGEQGEGRARVARLDPNPEPKCRERERPADPPHAALQREATPVHVGGGTATFTDGPLYVPQPWLTVESLPGRYGMPAEGTARHFPIPKSHQPLPG